MAVAETVAAPAVPSAPSRPGFWERSIAFIVDYAAALVIVLVITLPNTVAQAAAAQIRGEQPPPDLTAAALTPVLFLVYFVWFWSGQGGGRTWGMRVMGLRVTLEDGSPLTLTRALIRVVGLLVSCLVLFIGVIWAAFDAKKQGWHDKMAGSIVTYAETALYPPHPVGVTIAPPEAPNRFWAIPVIGILAKYIVLIPVFILYAFAFFGAVFVALAAWIPVLFVGRYPGWAFTFIRGLTRWSLHLGAFLYGLTDRYPWPGAGSDHPAVLAIEPPPYSERAWSIPLLGYTVKQFVLVPAWALTTLAGYGLGLAFVILWAPVLFGGSYPAWGHRFVQANLRWSARVQLFLFGLTDAYPDAWNWER